MHRAPSHPLLGCIADDLTGATDLGVNLVREGLSVIQVNGVPTSAYAIPAVDAIIVALKSRTIDASSAVAQSLAALAWLQKRGVERFYFKYCSTYDSTPQGNIGPVTEALQRALGGAIVPGTPAYPRNQRTVCHGYLFVGDQLLSETGMRHHPLTPMSDSNLVRLLAAQSRGRVGLVRSTDVDDGEAAVRARVESLQAEGYRHAIVDAVRDADLSVLGAAFADLPLTSGGAGLGVGLARALRRSAPAATLHWRRPSSPPRVIWLSGSCSEATQRQVLYAQDHATVVRMDVMALAHDDQGAQRVVAEAVSATLGSRPVLVQATRNAAEVEAAQKALGVERAANLIENTFRMVARAVANAGVNVFVVAGGETSSAVVDALGVRGLAIGPEIDPGVPWTRSIDDPPFWFALKSGNFGSDEFFTRATESL
ncbi:MAG: 3-oxo-tetronate kinase [Casimicrobiaceae bacterium]